MELRRMRSFISFQPGERRGCVGCHETREEVAAAPALGSALAREPSLPVPPPWGDRAISFLRDVQPVLDKHCTSCHAGLKPAANLDFSGGLTGRYNRAYDTILGHKLIAQSNVGEDARVTLPLAFGSHRSKLVQVLRQGTCRGQPQLTAEDWLRLVTWIDANGPYHDGFINKRLPQMPYELAADRELAQQLAAAHAKRCATCHQPGEVSRLDWVDWRDPRRSRFLTAPLAREAGGRGRCSPIVYRDTADLDYQALLHLLDAATHRTRTQPRRDVRSLAGLLAESPDSRR
jgi:mono/diheme cytochrome c family protein